MKYVSFEEYAKHHGYKRITVYNWKNRGRFKKSDIKVIKVKRFRINIDAKPN